MQNGVSKKSGKPYSMVTLEDLEGSVQVLCMSENYDRYRELLVPNKAILVIGEVNTGDEKPKFPDDVSIEQLVKLALTIKEKFDNLKASDEEKTRLGVKLQKGVMFIRFFKGEGKWVYAGKGIKLGDAGTAIFWYRPAGSQTYHVIYGDLSVKDAAEADLPRPIDKQ